MNSTEGSANVNEPAIAQQYHVVAHTFWRGTPHSAVEQAQGPGICYRDGQVSAPPVGPPPDLHRQERPRNNNCASKRDICINLLLAVRSLIVTVGLVAGDFNGGASRKDNARSPIEAAFGHTDIPWPDGAASTWGPGASWMMVCSMPLCSLRHNVRLSSNPQNMVPGAWRRVRWVWTNVMKPGTPKGGSNSSSQEGPLLTKSSARGKKRRTRDTCQGYNSTWGWWTNWHHHQREVSSEQ